MKYLYYSKFISLGPLAQIVSQNVNAQSLFIINH